MYSLIRFLTFSFTKNSLRFSCRTNFFFLTAAYILFLSLSLSLSLPLFLSFIHSFSKSPLKELCTSEWMFSFNTSTDRQIKDICRGDASQYQLKHVVLSIVLWKINEEKLEDLSAKEQFLKEKMCQTLSRRYRVTKSIRGNIQSRACTILPQTGLFPSHRIDIIVTMESKSENSNCPIINLALYNDITTWIYYLLFLKFRSYRYSFLFCSFY